MAAAAAPLSMSTDAMSSGLISDARFGVFEPVRLLPLTLVVLSIGTPSTTNSGCPSPDSDLIPRMRMYADDPGTPDSDTTDTPGALAASALTTFDSLLLAMAVESTELITLPSFSRVLLVPAPVTTTSPRRSGLLARLKFCVTVPGLSVIWTDFGANPISRAVSVTFCPSDRAADTVMVK